MKNHLSDALHYRYFRGIIQAGFVSNRKTRNVNGNGSIRPRRLTYDKVMNISSG
jgi:hypothetical protein